MYRILITHGHYSKFKSWFFAIIAIIGGIEVKWQLHFRNVVQYHGLRVVSSTVGPCRGNVCVCVSKFFHFICQQDQLGSIFHHFVSAVVGMADASLVTDLVQVQAEYGWTTSFALAVNHCLHCVLIYPWGDTTVITERMCQLNAYLNFCRWKSGTSRHYKWCNCR
jgi:hypothetical protein